MKRFIILFTVLLIVILLIGCGQKGAADPSTAPNSSTEETNSDIQAESEEVRFSQPSKEVQKPGQEPSSKAFVFDMSLADPMNGAPVYEEGVYNVYAVFKESPEGYMGEVEIIQKVLQAYDETSINYQPDGYLLNSFKSIFVNEAPRELPAEAKAALDQMSANDKGQFFYGMLPTATRMEMHFDANSFNFGIPLDYTKISNSTFYIPYLLSVDGNMSKLYIFFDEYISLQVEGQMKDYSAAKPLTANTDSAHLYINEKGYSSVVGNEQDGWQILFLASNEGDIFKGHMYLSNAEQKLGSIPLFTSFTGDGNQYESQIELNFQTFDEAAYRNSGGQMANLLTTTLSHMATADCQGNKVLFTVSGDIVYVELPTTSFQGIIEGKFMDSNGEIDRIFEESLDLYRAEFEYAKTGGGLMDEMGELEGQSLWLPQGLIPMTSPVYCTEQNLIMAMMFSYLEDYLFLDTIGPTYIQRFEGMRDFTVKEEFHTGSNTMELVFSYGNKTFYMELIEDDEGTFVDIMVFGQ